LKEITRIHIQSLLLVVGSVLGNSQTTIVRKINTLKTFFKFCIDNDLIPKSPMDKIVTPRIKKKIYLLPNQEDFAGVITYVSNPPESKALIEALENQLRKLDLVDSPTIELRRAKIKTQIANVQNQIHRDIILFRFIYSTFARISEVIQVKCRDFQISDCMVRLHGKGMKDRNIPIDRDTLELIQIDIFNRKLGLDDYYFVNRYNQPYHNTTSIQEKIRKVRETLNLDYRLSPHLIRKLGASHSYSNGADIVALQDRLGHTNPQTTRLYVITNMADLKKSMDFSPLVKKITPNEMNTNNPLLPSSRKTEPIPSLSDKKE
jgi:integrase/recombinase XerC